MIALQEGAVDFEQRSDFDPERRVSDFPVIGSGIRRSIKRACREVSTLPSISEVNQCVAGQVFSATHTTALPRCAAQRFSTGATEIGPVRRSVWFDKSSGSEGGADELMVRCIRPSLYRLRFTREFVQGSRKSLICIRPI